MIDIIKKRRLSRREFIQYGAAAGVSAVVAEAAFTAAARAEPKKGGHFRLALGSGSTTDTMDPATIPDTYNQVMSWATLRSSLTDVTPDGKIVPDLAESFESSPDAKKWVFRIRKGTEFHNGKSVEADDVVATFNYHRDPNSKSAAKPLLADITDMKADGKETVIFTLGNGNADFPFVVYDFHLPILPSVDGVADWKSGIGTGPYVMESMQPGVRFAAKRYANYHGETYFDEVEILSIVDVTARMNALIVGDVDFADRADLKTLPMLAANPGVAVLEIAGFAHYTAPMICSAAPFTDNNIRLALKYAFDRQELVDKVLSGHGTPASDNPIAKGVPFAIEPAVKHTYDPDKAKHYLKQAGLDTLKVDLSTADAAYAGAVDAAVLMKEKAIKAGIDINVVREPNDGYWANVWLKKPWSMSYWNGRTTVDAMLTTAYTSGAAWNETNWSNAEFDKLLSAARGETDNAMRAQIYADAQNLLAENGGAIVLMFNNFVNVHSAKLAHGPVVAPNYDVDGLKITQRWWFA